VRAARPAPRDWDAATYDRLSDPQVEWAHALLDRLSLAGDETVLDAGCGSGSVTRLLIERVPRGRVIAVDAAPSMLEHVRQVLRPQDRAIASDLAELDLAGDPVDAVFSNAVFHWLPDHDRLFRALFAALRPGGRVEAQCGGSGNVERFHAATREVCAEDRFAPHFDGWVDPWTFSDPEVTMTQLRRAGFTGVRCWLEETPVELPDPPAYMRTTCLGYHVQRLPEELREEFVGRVRERLPDPLVLDYVRLNISARRPA
jgi:trans-aconitate 2-methyltransferase